MEKVFDEIARIVGKGPYKSTQSKGNHEASDVIEGLSRRGDDEQNAAEPDDFHIYDVACDLARGELDDRRMAYLKTGFTTLLEQVL